MAKRTTTAKAAGNAALATLDGTVCEHCFREDLGSRAAGYGRAYVPVKNPYNHAETIGVLILAVCRPTVPYRPRCYNLVVNFGHERACRACWDNYPPGMELKYIKEAGNRWDRQAA